MTDDLTTPPPELDKDAPEDKGDDTRAEVEPDKNAPDSALTAGQRDQTSDLTQRMVDEGNAGLETEDVPQWLKSRAWERYQAHFEMPQADREQNARDQAARENDDEIRARRRG